MCRLSSSLGVCCIVYPVQGAEMRTLGPVVGLRCIQLPPSTFAALQLADAVYHGSKSAPAQSGGCVDM